MTHWPILKAAALPKMEAQGIGDTNGEVKTKALLDTLAYMLS